MSESEPLIRLGAFACAFAAMAIWELLAPRRPRAIARLQRWPGNLGLSLVNTLVLRLLFPAAAVGAALFAQARGFGLFAWLEAPEAVAVLVCVVALDLVVYLQHRLFHAVPWLWRLHRVHHADLELDVSTGVRFHPVEMVLSMLIKVAAVVALGAPPLAVLIFEIALNATTMFNHANVNLRGPLDRVLRAVVVTPDMHRVHHSVRREETDSNFGFNLPWWDHAFGSYRREPIDGHDGMTIGLATFRAAGESSLPRLLLQPLADESG